MLPAQSHNYRSENLKLYYGRLFLSIHFYPLNGPHPTGRKPPASRRKNREKQEDRTSPAEIPPARLFLPSRTPKPPRSLCRKRGHHSPKPPRISPDPKRN